MSNSITIITILTTPLLIVFGGGWVFYKAGDVPSWEAGVSYIVHEVVRGTKSMIHALTSAVKAAYNWLTHDDLAEYQRDQSLLLTPEEMTALLKKLEGEPYTTPTLDCVSIDSADCYRLDIGAFGLADKYRKLEAQQLQQLAQRVVANFWRECRGYTPAYYIAEATEHRMTLLVPLSAYGMKTLQRRIQQIEAFRALSQRVKPSDPPPLTEEADVSDRPGEGEEQ